MGTSAVITTPESILYVNYDGYPSAIMEWLEAQGDPRTRVNELVKEGGWDWRTLLVDKEESYHNEREFAPEEKLASLHQDPKALYHALGAHFHYDLSAEASRLTVYCQGRELSAHELELARTGIY